MIGAARARTLGGRRRHAATGGARGRKLDLRLVPGMTYDGAIAALRAHLQRRGFGDIEVNATGGYDPTSTDAPIGSFVDYLYELAAVR